jgi:hypothetical protein
LKWDSFYSGVAEGKCKSRATDSNDECGWRLSGHWRKRNLLRKKFLNVSDTAWCIGKPTLLQNEFSVVLILMKILKRATKNSTLKGI